VVVTIISIAGFLIGAFLFVRPTDAIEMQRKFYALINWKIEPISMDKEIKNTKIMGLFLVIFIVMFAVYSVLPLMK
jgi:hypothetical protein